MRCSVLNRLKTVISFLLLSLLLQGAAWAGFEEEVAKDLAVKPGYLVAPVGDMWLIDADAGAGVQVGDLFTIVRKGDPIIHPVTKELIGNLDEVVGVLRVNKVKSGYSYATVLSGEGPFAPGTEVARFANLPATFWDYTGEGEPVYADLQAALPELEWAAYTASQENRPEKPIAQPDAPTGLLFVLTAQGLAVKDTLFQPINYYRPHELSVPAIAAGPSTQTASTGASSSVAGLAASAPSPQAEGIVTAAPASTVAGGSGGVFGGLFSSGPQTRAPQALQEQRGGLVVSKMDNKEGIWYSPRVEGHPVGVDVGDFDADGRNEVAICFKDRLVVARVIDGTFLVLAEHKFGKHGEALSLDAMDLSNDGSPEFYVTIGGLNRVNSAVFELRGGQLVPVIENIDYFMRKVHMGDEGYVMLGQKLNPDVTDRRRDLSGPIFRINRVGDSLESGAEVVVPDIVSLYGFLSFKNEGRSLLANLNINDRLQVLEPGGATMWESSEFLGGTESYFERLDGEYESGTRYAYLKARLEPGPMQTLLVPVNEGNRTFGSLRQFRSSHLRAVTYDGYAFVERWRTKPQGGYMADFRLADADNDGVDEIVMLVMFSRGGWLKSRYGNSALLIYELQ